METPHYEWIRVAGLLALLSACGDDATIADTGAPFDSAAMDGARDGSGDGATDGGTGPLPAFRSGTRLLARTLSGKPAGFRDTELDIVCGMEETPAGTIRCLPRNGEVQLSYLDSSCAIPVALDDTCMGWTDGTLAKRRESVPVCGTITFVPIRLGAEVASPGTYYRRNDDGTCENFDSPYTYRPVEELPQDQFVAASRQTSDLDDALAIRHFVAEDGAVVVETLVDRTYGVPCRPDAADGTGRCVPFGGGRWIIRFAGDNYRTADCSEELVYETDCHPAGHPDIATSLSQLPGCAGFLRSIARIGDEVPAADVVRGGDAECPTSSMVPDQRYYRVTEHVAREDFVGLTLIRVGDDELQSQWWSLDGATPLVPGRNWFDAVAGLECHALLGRDDGQLCVPVDAAALLVPVDWFADASCTEPLVPVGVTECVTSAPPVVVELSSSGMCGRSTLRLFETGPAFTATTYYGVDSAGGCLSSPVVPGVAFYNVGAERPLTELPALEITEHGG